MAPKDVNSPSRPAASAQVSKSYASSLYSLADSVTGTFTSTLTSLSYPPVVSAARMAILSMMSQSIKYGKLRILTEQGVYTFPPDAKDTEDAAEIRVIRDTFWLRLVTLGDLGFAEAYMSGDCEVSDLVKVFQVCRLCPSLLTCRSLSDHDLPLIPTTSLVYEPSHRESFPSSLVSPTPDSPTPFPTHSQTSRRTTTCPTACSALSSVKT